MFPDMNPIEHLWDLIVGKMKQRNPQYQNIAELTNAIVKEWRRFPQERPRNFAHGMNRRVR
jgi:transposase